MIFLKRLYKDNSGATAIEYGLIIALIAAVVAVAVGALGGDLSSKWGGVSDNVDDVSVP